MLRVRDVTSRPGEKGGKRKTRRRKQRGGEVSLEFDKPEVINVSASGAI